MKNENNSRKDPQEHGREKEEKTNRNAAENHGQNALRNESNDTGATDLPTSEEKLGEDKRKKENEE